MENTITREQAIDLLKKYNKEEFHLRHALTVEAVMRDFANKLVYCDEEDYWGLVGLLHNIDFEEYPEQHCQKAPELLKELNTSDDMIRSITTVQEDYFFKPLSS